MPTLPEFWMLQRYTYIWTARIPFQFLIVHIQLTPFSSSVDITMESALKNAVFVLCFVFVCFMLLACQDVMLNQNVLFTTLVTAFLTETPKLE